MAKNFQTFNVSMPRELVKLFDEAAKDRFMTRSEFLRAAAAEYLKNHPVQQPKNTKG